MIRIKELITKAFGYLVIYSCLIGVTLLIGFGIGLFLGYI